MSRERIFLGEWSKSMQNISLTTLVNEMAKRFSKKYGNKE